MIKKDKRKLACFFLPVLVAVFLPAGVAAGMDIFGDFHTNLVYRRENKDFLLGPASGGDLGAYLRGNLYFSLMDRDLYHFMLDLQLEGTLTDRMMPDSTTLIAPVSLSVNQLFLQVPLSPYSFVYCGKRNKETGVSRFFHVSNRISPKFLSGFDYERNAPGFLEGSFIRSDTLANGFILYFRGAENWDQISMAAYTDLNYGNFTADGYLYYEELKNLFFGGNLSYQWGVYQFYLESIWKGQAEQAVVVGNTGNPSDDFLVRDQNNSLSTVFGVALARDRWSLALEYLYRQEGYDREEQRNFVNYFERYRPKELTYYSRYALLRHYLAASWSRSSFFHPDLTLEFSGIVSFQPVREDFSKYAAYELSGNIRYMVSQNCALTLYGRYIIGGEYGEFNNFSPEQFSLALVLSYLF